MLACGAGFGILQGAFELFGGRLDSIRESDDEFHDKEVIRRTTRIPVEQTVAEIGEGRGNYPSPLLCQHIAGPLGVLGTSD